jgi:hypothetical protein
MSTTNRYGAIKQVLRWAVLMSIFSLVMASTLCAQQKDKGEIQDTLMKNPRLNQYLFHDFDTFIKLSPSLRKSPIYWRGLLHQSLTYLPSSLSPQFPQPVDVVTPWKQELAKEKELYTLRLILQAIEAGGTAYVLYEHIKKYGLE